MFLLHSYINELIYDLIIYFIFFYFFFLFFVYIYILFIFFFFQAEDGIRDTSVTGVQTCALPISSPPRTMAPFHWPGRRSRGPTPSGLVGRAEPEVRAAAPPSCLEPESLADRRPSPALSPMVAPAAEAGGSSLQARSVPNSRPCCRRTHRATNGLRPQSTPTRPPGISSPPMTR